MTTGKEGRQKRSTTAAVAGRGRPPSRQVGALCWSRSENKGFRILLITSRDTGRWVIPKGWPMRRRTEAEAAAREAWEEAGLLGRISARGIGVFTYQKFLGPKRWIPCVVKVFPMEAETLRKDFPECKQRRLKWFTPKKAADKVQEPELAALIRNFDPDAFAQPQEAEEATAAAE